MAVPSADTIGPVEFIVVGFAGNRFTGAIAPALQELLEQGLIRILDLAVISKDGDGGVSVFEMQELSPEIAATYAAFDGSISGLLSEADLDEIAEDLEPNSTAAALLFEHVWASRFAAAVRAANGQLVLSERIPHRVIAEARASLLAAS